MSLSSPYARRRTVESDLAPGKWLRQTVLQPVDPLTLGPTHIRHAKVAYVTKWD